MLTRCEVTGGGFSRVFTHRTALCLPRFSLKHWGENHPQHFPMMKEDFGLWLVRMSQWFQCCSDNIFYFFFLTESSSNPFCCIISQPSVIWSILNMRVCGCLAPLPGITRQCVWMNAASSPFASSLSCDSPCKGQLLGSVAMATKDHMIVTHSEGFFFLLQHHLVFDGLCAITVEWSIQWLLSSTGYHRGLMFVSFCGGCLQDHRKRKGELFLLTVKISGTHWCVANNSATRCLWDVSGCNMNHIIVTKLISTLTSSSLP